MTPVHSRRTACRSCGGARLREFLSLGPTPLANAFLRSEEEFEAEPSFPLDVSFCQDCTLVQLVDVIDPELLFRDYIYVSGTSRTMNAHFERYARSVTSDLGLETGDLVLEVASNDGSLLRRFRDLGVRTLGIEPARNVAQLARDAGIRTVEEFFSHETAKRVRSEEGPANAVIGNNVLAHVDDTADFLLGMRELLAPGGRVIVEVPYLGELLDRLEYDTIYHEHLCYFSVSALARLFERAFLVIERIERVPVHGGSLRVFGVASDELAEHGDGVRALMAEEEAAGMTGVERYLTFARAVERNARELVALLSSLRESGHRLAAYGAPAKGNTLLNYCGIGTDLLPFTVDKSPMKVGLYTPGMHLPVRPTTALAEEQPAFTLILAWNFADEIMRQEESYRAAGGRFLVPIPEPEVLAA